MHRTSERQDPPRARVDLSITPSLRHVLGALRGDRRNGLVFLSAGVVDAAAKRLGGCGASEGFSWQATRGTSATFGTNVGDVLGASSAYASARRLGHSVVIAEKHYAGVLRKVGAG